jgi:hypothetical protein
LTNTFATYPFPALTRRPVTDRCNGPPTGTRLADHTSLTSASVCADPTNPSNCCGAFTNDNTPAPGTTENCAAVPTDDHTPPTSADPNPRTTDRPNPSETNAEPTAATGENTRLTDDDPPWSSVTVNVTVTGPPTAYTCDAETPPPDPPSPNDHPYETTDPSGSHDPDPSNEHDNPPHDPDNTATGS